MDKLHYIESLVDRFLEGRTTNAEERELYAWFRSNDVPEEWEYLREMFAWYEEGMTESTMQITQPAKYVSLRRVVRWVGGVAAAVIIGIVAWLSVGTSSSNSVYYEGYIVENGIRYDNIEDIEGDIEAMMNRADQIEDMANDLLAWADI